MADGSFDASALILKSESGSFSASALVLGGRSGSFGASAIILKTVSTVGEQETLFLDTFTRTVANGLGGSYVDDGGSGPMSVNGSKAVAGNGTDYGSGYFWNTDVPHPSQFDLLFDFSTQAAGTADYTFLWISLGKLYITLWPYSRVTSPLTYWVAGGKSLSDTSFSQVWSDASVQLDESSTYRARVRLDGNTAYVRLWKVGDSEPGTWLGSWDVTGGYNAQFWLDLESSWTGIIQTLDNLTVLSLSEIGSAAPTISALVLAAPTSSFGVDALVLAPLTDSFGVDAFVGHSFSASALISRVQSASFGISARIREPEYISPPPDIPPPGGWPGGVPVGDKIVIAIDAEDITTDVMYDRTEFVSQANGQAGTCHITILDRGRTQSFTTGQRIYVTVNDLRLWTGYVMRVKRVYPFAANSPAERLIEIEGLDVNILFLKRYAFSPSDPTDLANLGKGPQYPSFTDDTVVLADLFANYLDLTGDDIDTYSLVSHLGTINDNQRAAPIKFGETWGETMRRIGNWLSPIWYINPDRQVVWADVDVEDAPFDLSDNPSAGQAGVANLSIIRDGSSLVNDVLFVSAGYGDTKPVYKRLTDTASVTEHNCSQFGSFITGIYKQGTINRVADQYVNGNPQSRRGHKDDKVQVTCTVFQHGLRVGHKVRVVADAWGFDDVVPIRQLRLRWITANQPRYDLTITHELDTAWSLFDPYNPKIEVIRVEPPPPLKFKDPEPDCDELIETVFDNFNRTLAGSFGTASPSGETWIPVTTPSGTDWGVNGSELFVGMSGGTIRIKTPANIAPWQTEDTVEFLTRFHFHQDSGVFSNFGSFRMDLRDASGNSAGWFFQIGGVSGGFMLYSSPSAGTIGYALPSAWNTIDYSGAAVWFMVRWRLKLSTGDISAKVWLETDGEPVEWSVVAPAGYIQPLIPSTAQFNIEMGSSFASRAEYVDYIDFDYIGCIEGVDGPTDEESIGYVCQNFNFVTTTLTLNNEYVPYSVRAWVDGELTTDFTELTTTSIVLGFSPASRTPIRVCYLVRTDSEGGWMDQGAYHGGYIPK